MSKVSFAAQERKEFKLWGEFKAHLDSVEATNGVKKDKNGSSYVSLCAEFSISSGDGDGFTRKAFFTLPYDLSGDKEDLAGGILDLAKVNWKDIKSGEIELETEQLSGHDCVITLGSVKDFKTDRTRTYTASNGDERISYEITGVYPAKSLGKNWTDLDDAREQKLFDMYKDGQKEATAGDFDDEAFPV